jgi:predicted transcriptional regulator
MSTITEIQEAIGKLPTKEKAALAAWLQSQEEPLMSQSEEAALLARLDKAAAELDAGEGVPLERVREKIRGWAGK